MGRTSRPLPVKLIIGLIFQEPSLENTTRILLEKRFSETDLTSPCFDFDKTSYYRKEMGGDLKRRFLSFEALIPPERLVKIKLFTNALEKKLAAEDGTRRINIDPGYVSLSKLVLATTKNFAHRVYVGASRLDLSRL
jgi:hypothetical protein